MKAAARDGYSAAVAAARLTEASPERIRARERFLASGLPTRRLEGWRYTDLHRRLSVFPPPAVSSPTMRDGEALRGALAVAIGAEALAGRLVFVDGAFRRDLSSDAVEGVRWTSGEVARPQTPAFDSAAETVLDDLAFAFAGPGLTLTVAAGRRIEEPLHLASATASAASVSIFERHLLRLEAESSLTLFQHVGLGAAGDGAPHYHRHLIVDLAPGAELVMANFDADATAGFHYDRILLRLDRGARCRLARSYLGGAISRCDVVAVLGDDSRFDMAAAAALDGDRHGDVNATVLHRGRNAASDMRMRAALDDRARAVFQGRLDVDRGASGADAQQHGAALLLSPGAEFDAKPRLDIRTDEVSCAHGAAIGSLDADQMMYCRSRGLDEKTARALLIAAFLHEAFVDQPPAVADRMRAAFAAAMGSPIAEAPS